MTFGFQYSTSGEIYNETKNKRVKNSQGRSTKSKTPIIGAVEKRGNVVAKVVENTKESIIKQFLKQYVKTNSQVQSDEYRSYNHVKMLGYIHKRVNHSKGRYVIDGITY